jgi:hypothetical protein
MSTPSRHPGSSTRAIAYQAARRTFSSNSPHTCTTVYNSISLRTSAHKWTLGISTPSGSSWDDMLTAGGTSCTNQVWCPRYVVLLLYVLSSLISEFATLQVCWPQYCGSHLALVSAYSTEGSSADAVGILSTTAFAVDWYYSARYTFSFFWCKTFISLHIYTRIYTELASRFVW